MAAHQGQSLSPAELVHEPTSAWLQFPLRLPGCKRKEQTLATFVQLHFCCCLCNNNNSIDWKNERRAKKKQAGEKHHSDSHSRTKEFHLIGGGRAAAPRGPYFYLFKNKKESFYRIWSIVEAYDWRLVCRSWLLDEIIATRGNLRPKLLKNLGSFSSQWRAPDCNLGQRWKACRVLKGFCSACRHGCERPGGEGVRTK